MNDDSFQPLRSLSKEIIEVLGVILQKRQALDADTLTENLIGRPRVTELFKLGESTEPQAGLEIKGQDYDELSEKYNLILKEMDEAAVQAEELEDALKSLANILALIAEDDRNEPDLNRELKNLRETLKTRVGPARIDAVVRTFKDILFKLDSQDIDREAEMDGESGPEGIGDNIRDILAGLVKEITNFEDQGLKERADALAAGIASNFTLDNYEPFIQEINDLIFRLKELVRTEREDLYRFTQEIMVHLQETENDLFKTLDANRERLELLETDFNDRVAEDMLEIERTFEIKGLSLNDIRARVLDRIGGIRRRFREVRAQDEARIRMAEIEKGAVRKRLESVHKRYQDFTRKSEAQLKEMEKFKKASFQDDLTGVYNRRAYDLQIQKALNEFQEAQISKFCLIVFDVDYFRNFNNNFGHRAGDKILTHVARLARETVRREDFIARYGGDEFVLILPEIDLNTAARLAEKILANVGEVDFKLYRNQDLTVRVTLTMGVALSRTGDTPKEIFVRADQALYQAKEAGRNRVGVEQE